MLCSAGSSPAMVKSTIRARKTTITKSGNFSVSDLPLGIFRGDLPDVPLIGKQWNSRNNQFALAALKQIEADVNDVIARFGAHRIGLDAFLFLFFSCSFNL